MYAAQDAWPGIRRWISDAYDKLGVPLKDFKATLIGEFDQETIKVKVEAEGFELAFLVDKDDLMAYPSSVRKKAYATVAVVARTVVQNRVDALISS